MDVSLPTTRKISEEFAPATYDNSALLATVDQMIAKGEDPWQLMTDSCGMASEDMDARRWLIGDMACRVVKKYGSDRIGEFAKEIKQPVDQVKEWRTVCRFYPLSVRADFLQDRPNLTYSHFRKAKRLRDMEAALDLLDKASLDDWTVELLDVEVTKLVGKPEPPMKLGDFEGRLDEARNWLAGMERRLGFSTMVAVKIYEVKD
jgi:hypothetical protein